jgi:multidrug efflux pump
MHTPAELAPEEDQGIVFAVTKAPKYANIDYVDFYGEKLDKMFAKFPETDLRFVLNGINGPQGGIAGMLLKPWDERTRSSIKLKPLVQAELSKIEGVQAFAFNLPALPGGPGGLPVQMVINSTAGFQAVYEQMNKLKAAARKSGMFIVSDSDLDFNQPTVKVKIDRSKASDLGINMQQVAGTLQTLLGGNYTNRFNLEGRSYQVIPQVPRGMRLSAEALGGYYVPTNTGNLVPLSTIVSIETTTEPNSLTHYNQLNSATFSAVPMPGVTVGQAVSFLEGEAKNLPAGFSHDYLADSRQYVQEGNQLVITLGFAVIIIFLVLAAQFESLTLPLAVIMIVPMCLIASIVGVVLRGQDNNILTQVGFVVLIGLAAKNAILIVEFAKQLEDAGRDRFDAAVEAAHLRLRPILMTSFAFILGVTPLVWAIGAGAELRQTLGTAVFSGMIGVTAFGLIFTPVFYVLSRWVAQHLSARRKEPRKKTS